MTVQDYALLAAGVIGSAVALVHGVLVQRFLVEPIGTALPSDSMARSTRRLIAPLLHFSTFNWFAGGLALIASAIWLRGDARLATSLLVASSYFYGAVANCWARRGRHPGWILYAIALALIAFSLLSRPL